MIMVYQDLRQGVDIEADEFFTTVMTSNTPGHQWKLLKPRVVSRVRQNVFSIRVINEGITLPQTASVVAAPSLNAFKAKRKTFVACCSDAARLRRPGTDMHDRCVFIRVFFVCIFMRKSPSCL